MTPELIQLLTEMSTRNLHGGKNQPAPKADVRVALLLNKHMEHLNTLYRQLRVFFI
jgi:hypothetical protein